ncbi:DUF998 domain-containing protein [Thalassotalea euphylliae]|uniref:DUF998 domain-containing protein n=1 Tax=Thalassotalea euphylliae TaxID=1655234 RepID=UPI00363DD519
MTTLESIAALSGIIATVWISLGVYVAAKFYPNYSHSQQFCSELGATGSPTQKLSPMINNYPLGLIFCLFGWFLMTLQVADAWIVLSGILIIIHGIGTWVAGYFPMDQDPYTKVPSFSCKVHSWAGFIMLLSLLTAPLLVAMGSDSIGLPSWFDLVSIFTVVIAVYYLYKMAKSVKQKRHVGTYQRMSYWIKLLWLSTLSFLLSTQYFNA